MRAASGLIVRPARHANVSQDKRSNLGVTDAFVSVRAFDESPSLVLIFVPTADTSSFRHW